MRSRYHWVMAAQISHLLAGEEALVIAEPDIARSFGFMEDASPISAAAKTAADWFRLGCQGPDVFYHNQRTKPSGIHYGALAHRRNFGFLIEGAIEQFRRGDGGKSATWPWHQGGLPTPGLAYILGFATHAALDRAVHPFIIYFSGWSNHTIPGSERYRGCHPFLERLLDLALLAEKRGIRGADFDLEALMPLGLKGGVESIPAFDDVDPSEEECAGLLAAGLDRAYPKAVASDFLLPRRIRNAFADARYFYSMTNPFRTAGARADYYAYLDDRAGRRSIALVYPDTLPEDMDILNRAHRRWMHPAGDGRSSEEDYLTLYRIGVVGAARILDTVFRYLRHGRTKSESPRELAAVIGNGGLSITDEAGIPFPPLVSDPLPLPELMELEYRKRLERARLSLHSSPKKVDSAGDSPPEQGYGFD